MDGEYWFAIRTINRAGQATPEAIAAPGLRVLVDTKPPLLKLTAQPAPDGQVSLRWELDERNPKANSLRLAYRSATSDSWRPVKAAPQAASRAGSLEIGHVLFRPEPPAVDLECRGDVCDVAGNATTAYVRLRLPPVVPPSGEEGPSGQPPKSPVERTDKSPSGFRQTVDARILAGKPAPPAEPKGSVAIAINPPVGTKYSAPRGPAPERAASQDVPPGEHPRMVNTRLFELEYDVDSVGPSGIGRIELWGTTDSGKNWRRFPVGTDKPKVLTVSVEDEGIYGFRMVVTNGAGLGGRPPAPGDLPDIWIGVDLTKPTARSSRLSKASSPRRKASSSRGRPTTRC